MSQVLSGHGGSNEVREAPSRTPLRCRRNPDRGRGPAGDPVERHAIDPRGAVGASRMGHAGRQRGPSEADQTARPSRATRFDDPPADWRRPRPVTSSSLEAASAGLRGRSGEGRDRHRGDLSGRARRRQASVREGDARAAARRPDPPLLLDPIASLWGFASDEGGQHGLIPLFASQTGRRDAPMSSSPPGDEIADVEPVPTRRPSRRFSDMSELGLAPRGESQDRVFVRHRCVEHGWSGQRLRHVIAHSLHLPPAPRTPRPTLLRSVCVSRRRPQGGCPSRPLGGLGVLRDQASLRRRRR